MDLAQPVGRAVRDRVLAARAVAPRGVAKTPVQVEGPMLGEAQRGRVRLTGARGATLTAKASPKQLQPTDAGLTLVWQVLGYMGYVRGVIAEEGQRVESVIIALDDDVRVRRALSMVHDITFYRYQVSFKLRKA